MTERKRRVLFMAQFGILLAIEAIVCFTPLGSIPLGGLVATLAHVPVIVAAVTMGVGAGSLMGFFAGAFSFIVWTFMPPNPMLAFVFTPVYAPGNILSLVICFLPRILIGTFSGLVFAALSKALAKKPKLDFLAYGAAGVIGSLANTVLVLGGIYLFFGPLYAEANGVAFEVLLGLILMSVATNGVFELIIGAAACYAICKPVRKYIMGV